MFTAWISRFKGVVDSSQPSVQHASGEPSVPNTGALTSGNTVDDTNPAIPMIRNTP